MKPLHKRVQLTKLSPISRKADGGHKITVLIHFRRNSKPLKPRIDD